MWCYLRGDKGMVSLHAAHDLLERLGIVKLRNDLTVGLKVFRSGPRRPVGYRPASHHGVLSEAMTKGLCCVVCAVWLG